MLAPLIIELLIASLLFLLIGWLSDTLHASTHRSPRLRNFAGPIDSHQIAPPAETTASSTILKRPGLPNPQRGIKSRPWLSAEKRHRTITPAVEARVPEALGRSRHPLTSRVRNA